MFRFDNYNFNSDTYCASFSYIGVDNIKFTEHIQFVKNDLPLNSALLDRALFLAFILIGTSYYKAHPTPEVILDKPLDKFQVHFFNQVYQEGLSQFAFENHLTRQDLAHFATSNAEDTKPISAPDYQGTISLQSGGKDSLLTATLFARYHPSYLYISSSQNYPQILDQLDGKLQIIHRKVDLANLKKSAGLNGHVPITYIIQSLALIQSIINHNNTILTSIGQEGNEPHAYIEDLPVNHQWSKTWPAEQAFAEYVKRYISPDLHVGSPLRAYSELKIAELFAKKCWHKYGHAFSSCNVANYRQQENNSRLTWCGECAKCANTYLLFAPFIPAKELQSLFNDKDLFTNPALTDTFKGLLGVYGFLKPFECVGEIDELRQAYHMKLPGYADLPFAVPSSNFNYEKQYPTQPFIQTLMSQEN